MSNNIFSMIGHFLFVQEDQIFFLFITYFFFRLSLFGKNYIYKSKINERLSRVPQFGLSLIFLSKYLYPYLINIGVVGHRIFLMMLAIVGLYISYVIFVVIQYVSMIVKKKDIIACTPSPKYDRETMKKKTIIIYAELISLAVFFLLIYVKY